MERDKPKDPDSADVPGARPNGRGKAPLVINRNGPRKDLFSAKPSKENLPSGIRPTKASLARSQSAGISPDQGTTSPNAIVPRSSHHTKTSSTKTFSLKDAYRMAADAEDVGPGSPSPAPRLWRSRTGNGDKKTLKSPTPGQGQGSFGSRRQRNGVRQSIESPGQGDAVGSPDTLRTESHHGDNSDDDFDEKIKQFGMAQESSEEHAGEGMNGLFAKTTLGPKVLQTGKELSTKASNGSLDASSPPKSYKPWAVKSAPNNGWLKRAMSSPKKTDPDQTPFDAHPDEPPASAPTPNKSFAFDLDADFTAGDLQVSDSPPVKSGPSIGNVRQNTKLDEIRALELEADLRYSVEPPEPLEVGSLGNDGKHENGSRHLGRTNTKIDEIKARELETLSKRALANARLDEIREHNSETRLRSSSPELPRTSTQDTPILAESVLPDVRPQKSVSTAIREEEGERIPDTPITVFRKIDIVESTRPAEKAGERKLEPQGSTERNPLSRGDSWDALRRLARATSSSPAPESEQQVIKSDVKDDVLDIAVASDKDKEKDGNSRFSRRDRNVERTGDIPRRTVGFAGLQREASTDSDKSSKRSSVAHSDNDPTERIERELQLFAPGENHSEKGSVRAPSPESDREDFEETPRPTRFDPLMQPTPKVTGAYVETPATVKVERIEITALPEIIEPDKDEVDLDVPLAVRSRRPEISSRKPTQTSSAEGTRDANATRGKVRTGISRRSKSLGRSRSPLINSSQPPTVKDDLLEIQRTYQIEDSTLDDFGGFLAAQDSSPATAAMESAPKPEDEGSSKDEQPQTDDFTTDQKNSKAISRIGRSLESIRTARKGIERLEDEVSKAKDPTSKEKAPKSETPEPPHNHSTTHPNHASSSCPICQAQPPNNNMIAYIHLPVPRLWRRTPKFRFTLLGLLLFTLSLWYVTESTMCYLYCKPQYCYPNKPCVWSYDDPFWGHAIPVKLDQWTTGGAGRSLLKKAKPEVADWVADMWDAAWGTDITTVDTRYYDFDQRRQHRRRLMKRGLIKPVQETREDKAKYEAWARARKARERVEAMREMGYDVEDEVESMGADERVR